MEILNRFKWFILTGCSLIMFSLLIMLGIAVYQMENYLIAEQLVTPIPKSLPTETPEHMVVTTLTLEIGITSTPKIEEIFIKTPEGEIAFVMQVIDGDSIEVILDGIKYDLRYIGIDAPELGMPFSNAATEANQRLAEGQIVKLERDTTETDQYGRLLRYVYLNDGTLVNSELVRLGLAVSLAYPPDIKYQEVINANEQSAQEAGIGLWAPATAGPIPTDVSSSPTFKMQIDPSCSQFNAPGNDNHNKKEEYVCISNSGSEAVDMTGWTIHDNYGWTYQFPFFSLISGAKVRIITGCGADTAQELYWCKDETAVWNNDGDCVNLLNVEGQLVANYCY